MEGMNTNTLISIATLLHNDSVEVVEAFLADLIPVIADEFEFFEVVLIDNGSLPTGLSAMKAAVSQYGRVRWVGLSKQYDEEVACTAALEHCIGDFVVLMDLRTDPPSAVSQMIEQARTGYEVVIAKSNQPVPEGWLVQGFTRLLDGFCTLMTGYDVSDDWSKFVCFSRRMVNAILQTQNRTRFLKLLQLEIGYQPALVRFDPIQRGRPVFREPSLLRRFRFAMEMMISHSDRLLRFVSLTGFLAAGLNFCYILYVLGVNLSGIEVERGWTTLSLVLASMFGLLFLILAVLGEYVAHIFVETRKAPLYYVRDELDHSMVLPQADRKNVMESSHGK
jgi:dolichol-phosphate mannosyltransferase